MPHLAWRIRSGMTAESDGGRGEACGLRMLLLCLRYALLEDIKANGCFVLVQGKRRSQADRSFSAAQQQKSLLKRQGDDAVAQHGCGFAGLLALDDLNPDHQPSAADVAHDRVPRRPVA